jgi:hypothetical protein
MGRRIDPNARFERAKSRAKQETGAQVQQQEEALKRKFAAQGLQASGAAIKAEQQTKQAGTEALGRRLEDISGREEAEQLQRQEIEAQRSFQRGEREAGQAFGAAQAKLGREFARGEREAGQAFSSSERALLQKFQSGERLSSQDFAAAQALEARAIQQSQFEQQFGLAQGQAELAQKEFDASKAANAINALISATNSKIKGPQLTQILGLAGIETNDKGEFLFNGQVIFTPAEIAQVTAGQPVEEVKPKASPFGNKPPTSKSGGFD